MSRHKAGRQPEEATGLESTGWSWSGRFETLARWTFLAGLLAGATLFAPERFYDGFETPKLAAAQAAASLALGLGALSLLSRDRLRLRLPSAALPLLALFVLAAVSVLWAGDRPLALERLLQVGALVSYGLLAWALYRGRDIRPPLYFIIFAGGLIALWGLVLDWSKPLRLAVYPHFFIQYSENYVVDLYREMTSNQGNPNFLMHILVLTAPLSLGAALSELAAWRAGRLSSRLLAVLFSLTFLVEAVCFFRSQNRSSLLGMALALGLLAAALLLFHRGRILSLLGRRWKALVLAIVLALAALVGFTRFTATGQHFQERARVEAALRVVHWKTRFASLSDPHNIDVYSRVVFLQAGLRMVSDRPLLGAGIGQFGIQFPRYKTAQHWEAFHLLTEPPIKRWALLPWQAHNEFLQAAIELGLPGLLLFLAFWAMFGWSVWRCLGRLQGGPLFYLLLGAFCGLAGCLLNALLTFPFQTVTSGTFIWSVAGLCLAACALPEGKGEVTVPLPHAGRPVRLTVALACVVLVGLGLGAPWRYLRGESLYFDALKQHASNLGYSIQHNAKAAELLPGHYEILFTQGWLSQLDRDTTSARIWYERTLAVNPNFPETYEHLLKLYYVNGNYERAGALLDQYKRAYSGTVPNTILILEGLLGLKKGDAAGLQKASILFHQVGAIDPLMELAQEFQRRGLSDSCLAVIDTVKVKLDGDYSIETYPQVLFYEARVALGAGDTARARATLETITSHPSERDAFLVEQSKKILGTLHAK
ncbi:O-antigen ligase family protein [bacterium]|nr:O-antigen ligase family protein [bacterium]